jgi:hypothetical protein
MSTENDKAVNGVKEPLVRLETADGGRIIKHVFESFKELLSLVLFTFSPAGIKINGVSNSGNTVVSMFLDADKVRETCGLYSYNNPEKDPVEVYVNTTELATCLKRWSTGKVLVIIFPEASSLMLYIGCHDNEKHAQWGIRLASAPDEEKSVEFYNNVEKYNATYDASVTINSVKFHEYLGDASPASDTSIITIGLSADKKFRISGDAMLISAQNELDSVVDGGTTGGAYVKVQPGCQLPIQEHFYKKFIEYIAKANKACTMLTIFMKKDQVFSFLYDTKIGPVRYYIGNVTDDEAIEKHASTKVVIYRSLLADQPVMARKLEQIKEQREALKEEKKRKAELLGRKEKHHKSKKRRAEKDAVMEEADDDISVH